MVDAAPSLLMLADNIFWWVGQVEFVFSTFFSGEGRVGYMKFHSFHYDPIGVGGEPVLFFVHECDVLFVYCVGIGGGTGLKCILLNSGSVFFFVLVLLLMLCLLT